MVSKASTKIRVTDPQMKGHLTKLVMQGAQKLDGTPKSSSKEFHFVLLV